MNRAFTAVVALAALPLTSHIASAQATCVTRVYAEFSSAVAGQVFSVTLHEANSDGSAVINSSGLSMMLTPDPGSGSTTVSGPLKNGSTGALKIGPLTAGSYHAYMPSAVGGPNCTSGGPFAAEVSVQPAGGANEGQLSGRYVIQLSGRTNVGSNPASGIAEVGSIVADGQGGITGVLDANSSDFVGADLPITGSYVVNDELTASLTLVSSLGTQHLRLATPIGDAAPLRLVSTDQMGAFVSGTLTPQTTPAPAVAQNSNYSVSLDGETS